MFFFSFGLVVSAQVLSGWAFLAAESSDFPARRCAQFAKASKAPFVAALSQSFGRSSKCLKAFMRASEGKPAYWQYYAGNGSGRRKGILQPYEFLSHLSPADYNQKLCNGTLKELITRKAKRLRRRCMRRAHENATCMLSPELESQFTKCALNSWVRYARAAGWKRKEIVHNPVNVASYQRRGRAGVIERHGVFSPQSNYHAGLDGTCPRFCNQCGITGEQVGAKKIKRFFEDARGRERVFLSLWCPEHQGLYRDSGQAPGPRSRSISVSWSSFIRGNKLIGVSIGE